jgi:hypothetical protein
LGGFPGVGNLLDQYLKNPATAIVGSAVLLFQPPLMDILPIYIWFSFVTPLAFLAAQRWGWKAVIYTSLAVWLISQTRVRDLLVTVSEGIPYIELGPFDILAWQLLWISGLFFGQRFQGGAAVPIYPVLFSGSCWRWSLDFSAGVGGRSTWEWI